MSLGISIYPLQSAQSENEAYIDLCASLGFQRIFTSMLELDKDETIAYQQVAVFRSLLTRAKQLGMNVIIDVNPEVLKTIKVNPQNLDFFVELGATGIRLDGTFNGFYEAYLTYNEQNLDIEINGSFDTGYVNSILDLKGKKTHLHTCHNFYPEEHTGLSMECFLSCHQRHKSLGVKTAAFVTSQHRTNIGPWDVNDGLCTLEAHRHIPMVYQVQELYALGVDDVIIGDAFASEEELRAIAQLDSTVLNIPVTLSQSAYQSFFEHTILQNRWDYSSIIIRDVMSRKLFMKEDIVPQTQESRIVKKGSVLINNNTYGRYKGEILIALQDMEIDARRNVIGMVPNSYQPLFQYIKGGTRFTLQCLK